MDKLDYYGSFIGFELCLAIRNVPGEGIELTSTITATASSSSSTVTGKIRQLWSFSGFPEHACDLPVSLCSFSPLQLLLDLYHFLLGILPLLSSVSSLQEFVAGGIR
jgi:hypothetical protein